MANFNSLLQSTAFEAPKPRNFPPGTGYRGVLQQPKMGERKMQDKEKLIVTFPIKATDWPSDMEENAKEGLSLQGKTFNKDFILDKEKLEKGEKDELWALDQFLRSLGVSGGSTYEELLPMCTGCEVEFQLDLRKWTKDGEEGEANQVKKVTGI